MDLLGKILLGILGVVGVAAYIAFVIAKTKLTRRDPTLFKKSTVTPRLVYLFVSIVLSCILIPPFFADLFWRTLGTELPLGFLLLLSIGLGYFLVRWMNNSSLFAEVEGRDRNLCCLALFFAALIYPVSIVLALNNASLESPAYARTAVVTNKITGASKSGFVRDYVAFKGHEISECGGVEVSPSLYNSVELGANVVVYLKTGLLGFPVVVGIAKASGI